MQTKRRRFAAKDGGLTLLEVLMGVVILGTALAPVALLLTGGLQGSEVREASARSLFLAQAKMDEILALDWGRISPGTGLSDWVTAPDSVYRAVKVTVNPGGAFSTDFRQIDVTVGPVTLSTYKSNPMEP